MQTLSNSEPCIDEIIKEINDKGYFIIPNLIAPEKADLARQVLINVEESDSKTKPASTIKNVPFLATKDPIFRELLCHPLIVSLWHRYLGEDMICSSWSGITLHPNHASVSWHVDYPYWSIKAPYPTWNLSAQVIWMLDDFTEENGATGAIPGSHRYQMPPSYGKNEFPLEARVLTGKRGSAIVANCAYWHTARPNLTQKSRSALVGTYIRSFCIPCTDLRWQLDKLDNPTDLERQLLGGNQFCPKGENMF